MRGRLSAALRRHGRLAVALLLVLVAVPDTGATTGSPCPDCLDAGAAAAPIRVPPGTPLGGYGSLARRALVPDVLDRHPHAFWFKPGNGMRDPLLARALVLEAAGRRVTWVALDVIAVDRGLTDEVARRLVAGGHDPGTLLVSATHTHSGPGAFVDTFVMGAMALDRFDGEVHEAVVAAVVAAVDEARARRRPARLAVGRTSVEGAVRSRLRLPVDDEMLVLRVTDAADAPVAALWNFAIHGTVLGPRNGRLSGDVMGAASRVLERELGAPALFVNGAVGDVSPARHGDRAVDEMGAALAGAALAAWRAATPMPPTLEAASQTVPLPAPRLSLRNCLGGWVPATVAIPLGSAFPDDATLSAVRTGDVAWVAIPGELQTALGVDLKRRGQDWFGHTAVAGLTNDYLGYLVTPAAYRTPSYVTCASLYGAETGRCLRDVAGGLLRALAEGGRPAPAACDGGAGR